MNDFDNDIKDLNLQEDLKRPYKNKKKKYCPFCGNVMKPKLIDHFLFCNRCHKKVSGKIYLTDDKPLKPL